MIRKTALLTGIAGVMLFAAPAFAQDAMSSPSTAPQTAPAAEASATPAAEPATLTLQPGANVKASDGAVIGKLEGARSNAAGEQELTVRGPDGSVRAVPLAGLRPEGADVVVGWTSAEFQAAAPIPAEESSTDASATAPASDETAAPTASEPTEPAASSDTMTPSEPTASEGTAEPAPAEPQA